MTLIDLTVPSLRQRGLDTLPVAIIGAGPIGLAAAANLVERGIDFVIYESGDQVGVEHPAVGPHPPVLAVEARRRPGLAAPARGDRMAAPLARPAPDRHRARRAVPRTARRSSSAIASRIRTGVTIEAVTRQGMDRTRTARRAQAPFLLRARTADGVEEFTARAVIDASGTYAPPEQPRLQRSRPARARRRRRPGQSRTARRARPRPPDLRRPAHHRRRRRTLGGQHAARAGRTRRTGARHPRHLAHPQRECRSRHDLRRRRARRPRVDRPPGRCARGDGPHHRSSTGSRSCGSGAPTTAFASSAPAAATSSSTTPMSSSTPRGSARTSTCSARSASSSTRSSRLPSASHR